MQQMNGNPESDMNRSRRLDDCIPRVPELHPQADWRVSRLKQHLDSHDGQLGAALDQLCQELDVGVTGAHLSRLFRQEIGVGVREYCKRVRMRTAAQMLASTTLPVKHIAAELGYHGPADFFRQFKQQFKVTPREFRSLQRSGKIPIMAEHNPDSTRRSQIEKCS